jgi:acyl carrier protein
MSNPPTRREFTHDLVAWLNTRVVPDGVSVTASTELFANGLIDSVRILELIAWTERALDRRIPDRMIRMDLFGSVARIAETFMDGAP